MSKRGLKWINTDFSSSRVDFSLPKYYNAVKHLNIAPKDWEFSSFKKFVKQGFYQEDWCNVDNKNDIFNMDLE